LEVQIVECIPGKPVVVAKWTGINQDLPAILLNSHYDVVPVMDEYWHHDAFGAEISGERIYGRGTQDMKCICIEYVFAIKRLKESIDSLLRTVYLTFVPDEEVGGGDGLGSFIKTDLWKEMNIGVALDEGLANPLDKFTVFYGERAPWWITVQATGPTGHGSRFIKNTAVSKIIDVANKALKYREEQEQLLGHSGGCKHGNAKKLGDVLTLNLTMLKAGSSCDNGKTFSLNVIPAKCEAGFDIRIPPNMEFKQVQDMLNEWTKDEEVTWEKAWWINGIPEVHSWTVLDEDKNIWWKIFKNTIESKGFQLEQEIFPAATDSRFLRELGIPAFGFSPMRNTEILLHEHDEYITIETFLEGINIYVSLIQELGNNPEVEDIKIEKGTSPMDLKLSETYENGESNLNQEIDYFNKESKI